MTDVQQQYQTMMEQYKEVETSQSRQSAHTTFQDQIRLSRQPVQSLDSYVTLQGTDKVKIQNDLARIRRDINALTMDYAQANKAFRDMIASDDLSTWEKMRVGWHEHVTGNMERARNILENSEERRNASMVDLIDDMAEILNMQHEKALQGTTHSMEIKMTIDQRIRELHRAMLSRHKGSATGAEQFNAAKLELYRLNTEIEQVDALIHQYSLAVQNAALSEDQVKVEELTGEMHNLIDLKYGLMDGRLAAEGKVSDVRLNILNYTEGLQSARGSLAASNVNYQAASALYDAMSELEIKFRYAKEDMIGVFKDQAMIAAAGSDAIDMKDTLVEMARISEELMAANAELVTYLADESFKLLQTPLYDVQKASALEKQIRTYMNDLNAQKIEWAKNMQNMITEPTPAHYTAHT
jgi:hypothetical protein